MLKAILWAILTMLVLTPIEAKADFYKYTDGNGNTIFTDDLSKIPEDQRDKITKYQEPLPLPQTEKSVIKKTQKSTPENSKKVSATSEEMNAKKEDLEKRQIQLEQEYEALMKEKAALEHQQAEAKDINEIKVYNELVRVFSDKLNKYNKKRIALETEVSEYNNIIEKLNKNSK
jgi:chromosome segregation ATPase